MRLTLRTLLAYLDDILEPAEAKEIGTKISESSYAASLVNKVKDVVRRRRISAPEVSGPGSTPDPNVVAEYLDNTLAPESVADLERVCLESDMHLAEVAACPNVYMKVGGIGLPRIGFGWHARDKPIGSEELAREMALVVTPCIELFGPDRCMFESNFPVDKVSFSHPVLFNAFKRFSKNYSSTERAAMFHDTAVKAYRISYD